MGPERVGNPEPLGPCRGGQARRQALDPRVEKAKCIPGRGTAGGVVWPATSGSVTVCAFGAPARPRSNPCAAPPGGGAAAYACGERGVPHACAWRGGARQARAQVRSVCSCGSVWARCIGRRLATRAFPSGQLFTRACECVGRWVAGWVGECVVGGMVGGWVGRRGRLRLRGGPRWTVMSSVPQNPKCRHGRAAQTAARRMVAGCWV
ncbi:MAG: hypothetical protein J3K34DRAFT_288227 [Monoraphidium minutum]|nr:MAG: hypothetical protein J3K34DRAFT_288227 [Monoraphidium minutum]